MIPCEACARHVRAEHPACPFCGAAQPARAARAAVALGRRSRAAMLVIGASVGLASCGTSTTPDDGNTAVQDHGSIAPPYGIAPFDAGTGD